MLWQKPAFYGHPTLSTWFTSEYKKSGKKLDMGRGCVRVKSLEDLALDTRGSASGTGTRQRTRMSHAKREVGAACAWRLFFRAEAVTIAFFVRPERCIFSLD